MKRKILFIIYIIIICITLKLIYNLTINSMFINKYNNGEYSESIIKKLTHFNFLQKYIANYNYGNVLFQNGEYENAIEEYKKALNGIVPKKKECNIRINYALAICKTVQLDESDQESITATIKKYESAIEVLTEKGCANKNNSNGHSEKAEQLKKDILKEIERLKNLQTDEGKKSEEEKKDKNEKKDKSKEIEQKIQEIKAESTKEQRETDSKTRIYRRDFQRVEKNW